MMAIDVAELPSAAQRLRDLSEREREILELLSQGLASREIAQRTALSESTVYHVIADLLDAVEFDQPSVSAALIHERATTRPATADEVAQFHADLGPFETDNEG